MPKIGEMRDWVNKGTGEHLGYQLEFSGSFPLRKAQCEENERANSDGAPAYIVRSGRNEVGAMWQKGPDRVGNKFFELKLNGFPLRETFYLRAFATDDPAVFDVVYEAPKTASAGGAG